MCRGSASETYTIGLRLSVGRTEVLLFYIGNVTGDRGGISVRSEKTTQEGPNVESERRESITWVLRVMFWVGPPIFHD